MTEVYEFLSSIGFDAKEVVADGKMHRVGEGSKPQWYIAYKNHAQKDGQTFYVIVAGDWRTDEIHKHCTLGKIAVSDRAAVKKQMADAQTKAEAHRLQAQSLVAIDVQKKWESLETTGKSEYLVKKKIDNIDLGVRFDKGDIYVPARDTDGRLWTLQKIQANAFKQFHAGGRFRGCFHAIGDIFRSDILLLSEGLSTGASVHLATQLPVVVCFNSGNLINVAADLKKKYPAKQFLICGDNDLWTVKGDTPYNYGREKAEEAAEKCLGKTIFPEFQDVTSQPTDFNDLHALEGLDKVRLQILGEMPSEEEKIALTCLGHKNKEYFFTSTSNKQIVPVSAFAKRDFLDLMPLAYWEAAFPKSDGVDWDTATTSLMESCRQKGLFESRNVRGAGVWMDQGRIVVNMGNYLLVDGTRCEFSSIKSKFFYTLGVRVPDLHPEPLTAKECELITEIAHIFKWNKPEFGYLLAGSLVTSRVCGGLPIRPHVWITGEKGTGKSTLFNRYISPLIGQPSHTVAGNTTEAGIRQRVNADAVPLIVDEFEAKGNKNIDNIQSVLDLLRLAWSETSAVILKGSSGGNAQEFQVRCSAIVMSISQPAMSDADQSRFATIELNRHGDDPEHWRKLDNLLNKIDEEMSARLFSRVVRMMPILVQNFKMMKAALGRRQPGQRFGDQYGMLLAGYALLLQDDPVDESQADFLANNVPLDEAVAQAAESGHMDCFNWLMTKKIAYDSENGKRDVLIGDLINLVFSEPTTLDASFSKKSSAERIALLNHGIRVDDGIILIAHKHTELSNLFRGSPWHSNWKIMERISRKGSKQARFSENRPYCVQIDHKDVLLS